MSELDVQGGVIEQGTAEERAYAVNFANYGMTAPTAATVTVYDRTGLAEDDPRLGTNVTSTVMPTNTPSIATTVVTCSPLLLLTAGRTYRLVVKATEGSNKETAHVTIRCTRADG